MTPTDPRDPQAQHSATLEALDRQIEDAQKMIRAAQDCPDYRDAAAGLEVS